MKHDLITPGYKECLWGRRYLLFQLVFLGSFLSLGAYLLGIELTVLELNLLYFAINFVVVVLLCRRFLKASLGYGLRDLGETLVTALLGFLAYEASAMVVGMLIIYIQPDFANVNDQNLAAIGQENFALMTIGTVLLVPLTEEVFYRGILFGGLYRRSRIAAYAVSVLVFSLVHVSGYIGTVEPLTLALCFLQYIPAAICLAVAYERSGSLLPSILIHTAVNAMGMMAMR